MSNQLSSVLERLRAFGSERLAEFDAREEEHRGWLRAAVDEVRAQIEALAPATKRQRLDAGGAAQATAAQPEEQVRGGQWLGPGLGIVRCTERPSLASSRPRTALAAAGCRNLPSACWRPSTKARTIFCALSQPAEPSRGRKARGKKAEQQQAEEPAAEPAAEAEPAASAEEPAAKLTGRGRRDRKQPQQPKEEDPKEEQPGGSAVQL